MRPEGYWCRDLAHSERTLRIRLAFTEIARAEAVRDAAFDFARAIGVRPLEDDFVQPTMECPRCGAELPDFDGFGVLAHDACGYCTHPSRDLTDAGWVCGICGDVKPRDEEVPR